MSDEGSKLEIERIDVGPASPPDELIGGGHTLISVLERAAEVIKSASEPTRADLAEAAATGALEVSSSKVQQATRSSQPEQDTLVGLAGTMRTTMIGDVTIVIPPCSPEMLFNIYKLSAFLPPLVEAIGVNVYESGYEFEPTLNPDDPDDRESIRLATIYDRGGSRAAGTWAPDDFPEVSEQELDKVCEQIKLLQAMEHIELDRRMATLCSETSVAELLALTGQDLEICGNSYWEIRRDASGRPMRVSATPAQSMRASVLGTEEMAYERPVQVSALTWTTEPDSRRFRQYVQVQLGTIVARFKEFGDPRVMSRHTGRYYSSLAALQAEGAEQGAARASGYAAPMAATEILHIRTPYSDSSVYGMPTWAGNYPGILGSRNLDEENLNIVADCAVPSLLFMLSGGRMDGADWKRIKSDFENRQPGRKQIMLIQAQASNASTMSSAPTLKVERLKSEQTDDMLFQKYDERNEDKTHGSTRMPRALLGKDLGQNRATTQAMLRFANDQVFAPRRERLADRLQSTLFQDVRWHRFALKARTVKDPETLSKIVSEQLSAGSMTPNEARELMGDVLGQRYKDLPGVWASIPPRLTTALLQTKNQIAAAAMLGEDPDALQELVEAVRGSLSAAAAAPAGQPPDAAPGAQPEPPPGDDSEATPPEQQAPADEEPPVQEE